jgi:hypothetical protein
VGLKSGANIKKPRRMTRAKAAVERILLDSGMDFALGEEGGVDMVSPEFKRFGPWGTGATMFGRFRRNDRQ